MHRGEEAVRDGGGRWMLPGLLSLALSNIFPPLWSKVCVCLTYTSPPPSEVCGASSSTCSPPVKMRSPPEFFPGYLSVAGRLFDLLSPSPAGVLWVASGEGWDSRRCAVSIHWQWRPAPANLGRSKPDFLSWPSLCVTSSHSRKAVH